MLERKQSYKFAKFFLCVTLLMYAVGLHAADPLNYQDSYFGIFDTHNHDDYKYFKDQTGMSEQDFYNWADNHQGILNFHWSRSNTEFVWEIVEPVRGDGYNWDNHNDTDDNIKAYCASGQINLVAVIDPARDLVAEENWWLYEDDLKNYVRAVVERYDGDGIDDADDNVRVNMWQAYNEVGAWEDRRGWTRDQYVTFVTWMEEAVHDADPNAKIMLIAPGLQMDDAYPDWMKETIDDLIAAGVPFDAVDYHDHCWYSHQGVGFLMAEVADARSFLDSRNLYDVEIFSGENGTYFGCPTYPTPPDQPEQTEQDQARFLAQRLAYGPSVGLDHYLWANLSEWDRFGGEESSVFNSMGLVSDGARNCEDPARLNTERVAYWTYKMLAETIDRPANSFVGEMSLTEANNRYGYEYVENATGVHKYVLWSWGSDQEITFPINGASAHVVNLITDRYGNILEEYNVSAVGGQIKITIGDDPVIVIEDSSSASIEETGSIMPNKFQLYQNYPNPFNPQTTISYQLPVCSNVSLKIYDTKGQEVRTLVNKNQVAGTHSVVWNGKDNSGQQVSSGVYFYSLESDNLSAYGHAQADNFSKTKKLLLLK